MIFEDLCVLMLGFCKYLQFLQVTPVSTAVHQKMDKEMWKFDRWHTDDIQLYGHFYTTIDYNQFPRYSKMGRFHIWLTSH